MICILALVTPEEEETRLVLLSSLVNDFLTVDNRLISYIAVATTLSQNVCLCNTTAYNLRKCTLNLIFNIHLFESKCRQCYVNRKVGHKAKT